MLIFPFKKVVQGLYKALIHVFQIGQYIMTLPQYLDPFTGESHDGTESQQADNAAINVAVRYGRLPYTKLQGMLCYLTTYTTAYGYKFYFGYLKYLLILPSEDGHMLEILSFVNNFSLWNHNEVPDDMTA